MKIGNLKQWSSCLHKAVLAKDINSLWIKGEGNALEVIHLQKGVDSKGFSPVTLEKIVDVTKQLNSSNKDLRIGLMIGKLAFFQQTQGKDISSWDNSSLVDKLLAVWTRFCNLIVRGEFKIGAEIAQAYARHLLTFDRFSSSKKENIEECIKDTGFKMISQKETSALERQLLTFARKRPVGDQEMIMKCLGIWLLMGCSLDDAVTIGNKNSQFVGIEGLKKKQKDHLTKLSKLAKNNQWQHLQTHTSHPFSGFDWWMFPIDRSSNVYGSYYQLNSNDITILKKDKVFIKNYRQGVVLVAKSWGWDLKKNKDISDSKKKWTDYQVRLGKMAHSLVLFEQEDLLKSLRCFVQANKIELQDWIKPYLKEDLKSQ